MNNLIDKTVNDIFSSNEPMSPALVKLFFKKFAKECEIQAMTSIIELIGEMSWGIDLPQVFILHFMPPQDLSNKLDSDPVEIEPIERAINPVDMQPIYDAIYRKLQNSPEYNAWESKKAEYNRLLGYYEDDIKALKPDAERYRFLRESKHFGGMKTYDLRWFLPRKNRGDNLGVQLDKAIDAEIRNKNEG